MKGFIIGIFALAALALIGGIVFLGSVGKLSFSDDCALQPVEDGQGNQFTSFDQVRAQLVDAKPSDAQLENVGYVIKDGAVFVRACVEEVEVPRE